MLSIGSFRNCIVQIFGYGMFHILVVPSQEFVSLLKHDEYHMSFKINFSITHRI